jgi:hypothetical protein
MLSERKYAGLFFLINLGFSIIPHLILHPLWMTQNIDNLNLTMFEILYTMFFLPIILLVANYKLNKKYDEERFVINGLFVLVAVCLSGLFHFKNWADSVGSWSSPDAETLMVVQLEITVGIVVSLLGIAIMVLGKRFKNKES